MVAVTGHFGEWLQGRDGPAGALVLVTVNCPALTVTARRLDHGALVLEQEPQMLTQARAAGFLQRLGAAPGRFRLRSDMPVGGGAGASTAALVALARAAVQGRYGGPDGASPDATCPDSACPDTAAHEPRRLAAAYISAACISADSPSADRLAAACLAAEGASDPLMLARPDGVVWRPRDGRVVAPLMPLPRAEIVGGFWGPPIVTDPEDLDFPDIGDLLAALGRGAVALPDLAAIATESARRCSALRGPQKDPTEALGRALGAMGHLRAHTGSARGLVFAPGSVPDRAEAALRQAGFARVLRFRTGGTA